MSLSIAIELSDDDLKFFVDAMHRSQQKAARLTPQQITDAAAKLLVADRDLRVPQFIAERLAKLESMIAIVKDAGFALPEEDRKRVLACLAYFTDPQDVIPDDVPVLGYLDDAIMIELCQRELEHEIEAYEDFCAYRNDEALRRGVDPASLKTERVEWAEARRVELLERMRKRRGQSYSRSEWQPALFRVG